MTTELNLTPVIDIVLNNEEKNAVAIVAELFGNIDSIVKANFEYEDENMFVIDGHVPCSDCDEVHADDFRKIERFLKLLKGSDNFANEEVFRITMQ